MTDICTYIMEFRGGTYTTQVKANSLEDSLIEWVKKLKLQQSQIKYMGSNMLRQIDDLVNDATDNEPTSLEGLKNVWYLSLYTNNGLAAVNIVKTLA